MPPQTRTPRASDRAYERLREEILDGVIVPGTVLAEVEQSARLGVSRTPLREALSRLTADGLIAHSSAVPGAGGRGLVVTELSLVGIVELYELREALEEQAARLAAIRRDPAVFSALVEQLRSAPSLIDGTTDGLHAYYAVIGRLDTAIDEAVDNDYLASALGGVRTHLARIRRIAAHDPERLKAAATEHLVIAAAIADGDGRLAAHATTVHLRRSRDHILDSAAARYAEPGTEPVADPTAADAEGDRAAPPAGAAHTGRTTHATNATHATHAGSIR